MRLTINGQTKDITSAGNIAALVSQFCANKKHIIAEINGTIVPSTKWDSTSLKDGDTVELVAFVGGG
jgi:thiamine biosynthesis protein ThiS